MRHSLTCRVTEDVSAATVGSLQWRVLAGAHVFVLGCSAPRHGRVYGCMHDRVRQPVLTWVACMSVPCASVVVASPLCHPLFPPPCLASRPFPAPYMQFLEAQQHHAASIAQAYQAGLALESYPPLIQSITRRGRASTGGSGGALTSPPAGEVRASAAAEGSTEDAQAAVTGRTSPLVSPYRLGFRAKSYPAAASTGTGTGSGGYEPPTVLEQPQRTRVNSAESAGGGAGSDSLPLSSSTGTGGHVVSSMRASGGDASTVASSTQATDGSEYSLASGSPLGTAGPEGSEPLASSGSIPPGMAKHAAAVVKGRAGSAGSVGSAGASGGAEQEEGVAVGIDTQAALLESEGTGTTI